MLRITELRMNSLPPALVRVSAMPCDEKSEITVSSMKTAAACVILTPFSPVRVPIVPEAPAPLMLSPRSRTVRNGSLALTAMLILTPLVPLARIDPNVLLQSMVMDLVIVTVPKPPGSRQSISPLMKVLEIAPAKVLQGAVRLQGLTSSPTPETQVRVAWAWAGTEASNGVKNPAAMASKAMRRMIYLLVFAEVPSAVLNHDEIVS